MATNKPGEVIEYRDKRGQWRWRVVRKGRCLCDSGESYIRRVDMRRAMASVAIALERHAEDEALRREAANFIDDVQPPKRKLTTK